MALYVVTGGAGFIGSHLVDSLLSDRHDVYVLDDLSTGYRSQVHSPARLVVADVNDRQALETVISVCAGVFHLAAVASVQRSVEDWLGTHDANQRGTIAVYDCARAHGVPVVYASSAAVYGDVDADGPIGEDTPTRPLTAYGADKLACELHARVAGAVHGVRTFGLRFFNVYGPRQDAASPYSGVVSKFAQLLAHGQPLTVFGDGGQTRDFIYVADVVRSLRAAMEAASTEAPVSNVCTGKRISVLDLAETMGAVLGIRPIIAHAPARTGEIRSSLGNPAMMSQRLGVRPEWDLFGGLRETLRWYCDMQPAAPRRTAVSG